MSQIDVYYEAAQARLASQDQFNNEISRKVAGIVALGGALVGAGAILLNSVDPKSNSDDPLIAFICLAVFFLGVCIAGVVAMFLRTWYPGPKLSDIESILDRDEQVVRKWVATTCRVAVERNLKTLDHRATAVNACILGAILQVACLIAMAIVVYYA